jgi:hypothetical protein
MDLAKQYVILWLVADAARLLLPDVDDTRVWGVMGQVQGETPGVGLWIRIESIASVPGDLRAAPSPAVFLVPWHTIRTAQLLGARPADLPRSPGFLS